MTPTRQQTGQSSLSAIDFLWTNLLQRKCACGGSAGFSGDCESCRSNSLLGRPLQRKLTISEPSDRYEQEADRIADQVMASHVFGAVTRTPVQVQRFTRSPSAQPTEVPASVDRVLASSGRPLDSALELEMGHRFGYDFSRVRVHTDDAAAQSARGVNAHAYTGGKNIVFGEGLFAPGSHVVQQHKIPGLHIQGQTSERPDRIHDPLLNDFSRDTEVSREQASQHSPEYERWLHSAPCMTSRTTLAAPDGTADTRTRVGPAEEVTFNAGGAADWTASTGTPTTATAVTDFVWTAPEAAGTSTISARLPSGSPCLVTMKTVAPTDISMTRIAHDVFPAGTAGARMRLEAAFSPRNVSFGNVDFQEVPGPAINVTGYFDRFPRREIALKHRPYEGWLPIWPDNTFRPDVVQIRNLPRPWADGGYEWRIPYRYRTSGASAGIVFTKIVQAFTIDAAGTVTITKGGARVDRRIDGGD